MVKLTGPLQSLAATGSIANLLTFQKTRQGTMVKMKTTPHDAKSDLQIGIRAMVAALISDWHLITTARQATWQTLADENHLTLYQAFLSYNMSRWRQFKSPSQTYPATTAGTLSNYTITAPVGGQGTITHKIAVTLLNDGWGFSCHRVPPPWSAFRLANTKRILMMHDTGIQSVTEYGVEPGTYKIRYKHINRLGRYPDSIGEWGVTVT